MSEKYPIIELDSWLDLPDNPLVLDKEKRIAFGVDEGCVYFARVDPLKVEKTWGEAVDDRGGMPSRVGWKLVYGKFPGAKKE